MKTIVDIKGGLGNQMFCYATGYAISKETGKDLYIDTTMLDSSNVKDRQLELLKFNIEYYKRISYKYKNDIFFRKLGINRFNRFISTGIKKVYIEKKPYEFDANVFSMSGSTYYDGFWQTHMYFSKYKNDLLKMFTPKFELSLEAKRIMTMIKNTNSVSIHIRRGDYIGLNWNIPMTYYKDAINLCIEKQGKDLQFFVFSDDCDYCETWIGNNQLSNISVINYISDNKVVEDMLLMSKCNHHIIANSSYSWWAAYMGTYDKCMVICPEIAEWKGDFYPKNWIKMKIDDIKN